MSSQLHRSPYLIRQKACYVLWHLQIRNCSLSSQARNRAAMPAVNTVKGEDGQFHPTWNEEDDPRSEGYPCAKKTKRRSDTPPPQGVSLTLSPLLPVAQNGVVLQGKEVVALANNHGKSSKR